MAAEAGHAANRAYFDQAGAIHLNGASLFDANETDMTVTQTATTAIERRQRFSPQPTDTYAASMTIDVTYTYHIVAGVSGTSATVTYTPSAAGTAGDLLIIATEADASGTVTATFASTFHPSGTQATTASHFSTITFISDGTRWLEVCRTTALA